MADTAIRTEEEKKEYFDSPEELEAKVTQLAEWILTSQYFTAFTGAGISTAAGIPDYRSGYGTVLETGPGCWEKAAFKAKYKEDMRKAGKQLPLAYTKDFRATIQAAHPTRCHMALAELMNRDMLKAIVSQNVDGLHRKSGIHPDKIAELHGNTNLEVCAKCGREHMRDFRVRTAQKTKEHQTGRLCDTPSCRGVLKDTIINFGENLNEAILNKGYDEHARSDLVLVMGSSLRVSPANQMPFGCSENGGNVVIVNLQKTSMDNYASLVIHERIDKVIDMLMDKLQIPVPEWRRSYRLEAALSADKQRVSVTGVDVNGACYTLFKSLKVSGLHASAQSFPSAAQKVQPFQATVSKPGVREFDIECVFQGHYSEPKLTLKVPLEHLEVLGKVQFNMIYHVASGTFERVEILDSTNEVVGEATFTA